MFLRLHGLHWETLRGTADIGGHQEARAASPRRRDEVSEKLYLGDCLDFMRTLAPGSVDAVVTDPPYLDGDFSYLLDEFLRIGKRVVLTPGKLESFNWIRRKAPAWEYVWRGSSKSMGGSACMHIGFEPILAYHMPLIPLGNDVLDYPVGQADQKNGHVWPKPLKLFKKLVYHWTREGETVFDPFTGSGTTGQACIDLGRNFIGCEIDPGYYAIAEKRIKAAQQQPRLAGI
jgi:DNA modification methylase